LQPSPPTEAMPDGDSSTFAKLSEHATGNAVDILALGLADKRQIGISAVANELSPGGPAAHGLRLLYHAGTWR
jgi:hypothetical protein